MSDLDVLRENESLRTLLEEYGRLREQKADADWHDRVMEWQGREQAELCDLYGSLLAEGWLDSRVHVDAFTEPGKVGGCYRITREGIRALRNVDNPFGAEEEESGATNAEEVSGGW